MKLVSEIQHFRQAHQSPLAAGVGEIFEIRLKPCKSGEGVRRFRSNPDSLKRFSGVGVRFTPTFTPTGVFFRELDRRRKSLSVQGFLGNNPTPAAHHP